MSTSPTLAQRVDLQPGSRVAYLGEAFVITHVLDLDTVLGRAENGGRVERLLIPHLAPTTSLDVEATGTPDDVDLSALGEEDWQEATRRFLLIRPLLKAKRRRRADVEEQARAAGVHAATIYRWIEAYLRIGKVSALLPEKPSGGRGKSRLPAVAESIVQATIEDYYFKAERPNVQQTCREVARRCRAAGIAAPGANTVRRRIASLADERKIARRVGRRAAREQFSPLRGSFPGAEWPLSVIQVDHTQLDIVLVDDVQRLPVGRPWITVAIDVFSRMVLGFYVSFDSPGALSVGLCLAHAILPKEEWLARRRIEGKWPCWGIPGTVHVDNAKEFRGMMLQRACEEYGITLEWRPVKRPSYGGHIERLLGTLLTEIHTLPGTTFSSVADRGTYDAQKNSALTLSEFEVWLATYITGVYHQQMHEGVGTSPLQRFHDGVFGGADRPGTGLPSREFDARRLTLDFMPYEERTVQRYGVAIDGIRYNDGVLTRWIHARDPESAKLKRKFRFRRDPRDISVVYFFDPELKEYYEIPYRNTAHPPISVWELREATRRVRESGRKQVDEDAIFEAYTEMRRQEERAVEATMRSRRARQRRRHHRAAELPAGRPTQETDTYGSRPVLPPAEGRMEDEGIRPFEEVEILVRSSAL